MTNLCTKVTVRKRPIKNGQTSLYLDFYPPIRNPKTGRLSRREYLGFYIYTNPTEKFQQEYNRSMLQKEELFALSKAECKSDVLRRAGLFSCLTGLRLSDCILLQWENIKKSGDGGWVLDITTKKTKTDAILPISDEALALCGVCGGGQ